MWEEATNYCSHERGEGQGISLYRRPNGLYHYNSTPLHEQPDTVAVNRDTNQACDVDQSPWRINYKTAL